VNSSLFHPIQQKLLRKAEGDSVRDEKGTGSAFVILQRRTYKEQQVGLRE
jgi:hypothetical protein